MNGIRGRTLFAGAFTGAMAAMIGGCAGSLPADSAGEPKGKLIITHVMHQMTIGAVNNRNETHLSVEPTRENGIMAQHIPEYMMNYGKPLEAARQDIALMRESKIDAMGMLLCNGHLKSQFGPMIHAYYKAAGEDGHIKIFPDTWSDITKPEGLAEMYGELLEKYPDVWLKRDGRLVVTLCLGYGSGPLPPYKETTDKLFSKVGGRSNVYLVLYWPRALKEHNPEWFKGADALTDWLTDSYGLEHSELKASIACAKEAGKEFWYPVMPSFAQSRYPHEGGKFVPNLREKLGSCWFRESWMAAIDDNASVVGLQTWNDLSEDSAVMPESNHDWAFFELNKYYAGWFKSGKAPAIDKEEVLLFHHPQVAEGLKLPPGVKPMEGFPFANGKNFNSPAINRTPPTDYAVVNAMLKAPAKVTVMLGEKVLAERELPAGLSSWLIYQPRNQNDPKGSYKCDESKVYPDGADGLLITKLDKPFYDAEVFVSVSRDGRRLGFFRSHRPVAGAAGRGDMTVVGDAFKLQQ